MQTTKLQEVVAIIDRSGSMFGKEADTIGGINVMLNELKERKSENEQINVSIKLFDHEEILLHKSKNIDQVENLRKEDFLPRGQTALLDAIGTTLAHFMEKKLIDNNAFNNCLIYIATDGIENASKIYTREKIKKMINTAKTEYNIDVLYLGANQDAILEASAIGIDERSSINYSETADCIEAVYRSAANVANRSRSCGMEPSFTQAERSASQIDNRPPLIRRQTDIRLNKELSPPKIQRSKTSIN